MDARGSCEFPKMWQPEDFLKQGLRLRDDGIGKYDETLPIDFSLLVPETAACHKIQMAPIALLEDFRSDFIRVIGMNFPHHKWKKFAFVRLDGEEIPLAQVFQILEHSRFFLLNLT